MVICVVSGKGGTGKTSISVGLAAAVADVESEPVRLLDCDVEAPNAHLYFAGNGADQNAVTVTVPAWDSTACDLCGDCVPACEFGALGLFGEHLEVFTEHCHSCGACSYACTKAALIDVDRRIGAIHRRVADGLQVSWGALDVGEPRAVPVIDQLRASAGSSRGTTILDGPPGTSCPLVAAAGGVDAAVIVTEPTVFGLHDLKLVRKTLDLLGVPCGVVINKCQGSRSVVHDYCLENALPVLLEVPLQRSIAISGAQGIPLPVAQPEYRAIFQELLEGCRELAETRDGT